MKGLLIFEKCEVICLNCWVANHLLLLTRSQRVMAKAKEVFGRIEIEKHWFVRPAIGLAHLAPCSLLGNHQSYEEVCDYLCRLEYCVYT